MRLVQKTENGGTIVSNFKTRPIIDFHDMPKDILAKEFEWASELDTFFIYKGEYYCLANFEFTGFNEYPAFYKLGWHGVQFESYNSGVVVRRTDDENSLTVGRFY